MKSLFGRIGSYFVQAILWLYAGARTVLDLIGYSTAPDDAQVAKTRLEQLVDLLLSVPWWAALGAALIATLWLMKVSWPGQPKIASDTTERLAAPQLEIITKDAIYSDDPEGEALDKQAYNEIVAFWLDVLQPACYALWHLQDMLIHQITRNNEVAYLTLEGMRLSPNSKAKAFLEDFNTLSGGLGESPGPIIKFDGIIDLIWQLEKGSYREAVQQALEIAKSSEIDLARDKNLKQQFEEWRARHNNLINAYPSIQRDGRFGKLHRLRTSRWGDEIEAIGQH